MSNHIKESVDNYDDPPIEALVSEYTSGSAGSTDEAVARAIYHADAVNVFKAFRKTSIGFDPNCHNGYYPPTLNAAVESLDEELVTYLLSIGADPNVYYWGESPLESAARERDVTTSTLSKLLAHGAKTEQDRALHWAAATGSLEKARILLGHNMDVKAVQEGPCWRDRVAKGTPLHEAAGAHYMEAKEKRSNRLSWDPREQEQLIMLLLDAGADPQSEDDRGDRPENWVIAGPGYKKPDFKQLETPMPNGEAFDEARHLERIKALLRVTSPKSACNDEPA